MSGLPKTAWRALAAAVLLNLFTGFQYCWSILGAALAEQNGWSAVRTSLPFVVITISGAISSIFAGRLGERFQPGAVTFCGGLFLGVGLIAASISESYLALMLSVGIFTGCSAAFISCNTSPVAMKWFPSRRKGLVVGVTTMCVGASSLYMAPVINGLLNRVGIQMSFRYLGLVGMLAICLISFFLPTPQRMPYTTGESGRRSGCHVPGQAVTGAGQALKTRAFWALFVIHLMSWMPGQMLTSSVAGICQVQAGWADGYIAVMAMSIGNVAGRFSSAALSDRLGTVTVYRVLFALQGVNLALLAFHRTPAALIVAVAFLGFCVGSGVSMQVAMTADLFGQSHLGSISGMLQPAYGLAGVLGPVLAAAVVDRTGAYGAAYLINVFAMLAGLGATFFLGIGHAGRAAGTKCVSDGKA